MFSVTSIAYSPRGAFRIDRGHSKATDFPTSPHKTRVFKFPLRGFPTLRENVDIRRGTRGYPAYYSHSVQLIHSCISTAFLRLR